MNIPENSGSTKSVEDTSIADSMESPLAGQPDDLHDLIGSHASVNSEEEDPLAAYRDDPNYSALIRDLEYIAKQARLLFEPAQEAPRDEVWDKIQSQLSNEPTGNE